MSELAELQTQFLNQITSAQQPENADSGLQVYRDAYLLRLDEALRTDFDVVHQILGDKKMFELTSDYVAQYPPKHNSIRWAGHSLVSFIEQSPRWANVPLLASTANFEWTKSGLFDAANSPIASLEDLQQVAAADWGQLKFELIPALKIRHLPANVPPIWQQLHTRENISPPTIEAEVPWLMWRKDLIVNWRSLDEVEHCALQTLLAGANFAQLCENLLDFHDENEVPNIALQLLMQWLNDQVIKSLYL